MKARNVFVQGWNYPSWLQHPACLHSESVPLCPPPCATLIWTDKLTSGNSHRTAYGAEEDTVQESFYSLFTLDRQTASSPALSWDWSGPILLCSSSFFTRQPSQSLLCFEPQNDELQLRCEQSTWCTTPPSREAAVLSTESCPQMRAQKQPQHPEMQPNTWQTIRVCVGHLHTPHTLLGRFSCIAGILFCIYIRKF